MKRNLLFLILIAAVLCGITGCRRNRGFADNGKINVLTTIFAPYDFVRNVTKDKVNLIMLLPPSSESHSFEPSPQDIVNVMNSDVFIYNGGESDVWVQRILESMNTDEKKILVMMDVVDLVEEEIVEGMEYDEDDEDDDDEYDEHIWTSPVNAILIIRAITDLLCEADPANAAFYGQNSASYITELQKLDNTFKEIVAGARRKTIVFGDRFPFRYFADAYGLEYFAAFPGCSTETEPSVQTVAFLINKIKSEQIPVVFHIELSNERMANTISSETGAKKLLLHSVHNVTKKDFDSGLGYLDFMRRNTETLREALY